MMECTNYLCSKALSYLSWSAGGMYLIDLFLLILRLEPSLAKTTLFTLTFENERLSELQESLWKGFLIKAYIRFCCDECGAGFQFKGLGHLLMSCFLLQCIFTAVATNFSHARASKLWSWIIFPGIKLCRASITFYFIYYLSKKYIDW